MQLVGFVITRIVYHNNGGFDHLARQAFQLLDHKSRCDHATGGGVVQLVGTVSKPKAIQSLAFADLDMDGLILKLPAIGHIALLVNARLITVEVVDNTTFAVDFQQAQSLIANLIQIFYRSAFWSQELSENS